MIQRILCSEQGLKLWSNVKRQIQTQILYSDLQSHFAAKFTFPSLLNIMLFRGHLAKEHSVELLPSIFLGILGHFTPIIGELTLDLIN